MKVKPVGTKQGLQWILNGVYQFRQNPLVWIILCGTLYAIIATLSVALELYGLLVFIILFPSLQAGLWTGCKALEQNEKLQFSHLFAGFKISPVPLLTLGAISLVGQLLIFGIISTIAGDVAMDYVIEGARTNDETEVIKASDNMLSALIAGVILHLPLIMAVWFAPLLIIFNKMTPICSHEVKFYCLLIKSHTPPDFYYLCIFTDSHSSLALYVIWPCFFELRTDKFRPYANTLCLSLCELQNHIY